MHSNADGPAGSRADATGEVAPSLKCIRGPSGPTGIYILLYEITSDTHVWSYVFMCGTSGQYFWTYILEMHSGAECLLNTMLFLCIYSSRHLCILHSGVGVLCTTTHLTCIHA